MESPATSQNPVVMVLDDEKIVRRSLQKQLERSGYRVLTAQHYGQFTKEMTDCDAVLCDIILPGSSGLVALKWAREHYPNTPVILMTGQPTYETAAEAIRLGAFDYLTKPVNKTDLLLTLERAIKHRHLMKDKERLEAENEAYRLRLEEQVVQQTQALHESQEFLTTLTNTMADAVFSLSMPDFIIEYVNQAVVDIFDYSPEALLGKPFSMLFTDENTFGLFSQKYRVAIAAGNSQMRIEQPMCKKDGSTITAEVVSTFIRAEDDRLVQMISVVRDVTQRSFLLGVVAHELRSPLSLVTGFLHVLLGDIDNTDRGSLKRYLGIIDRQTSRMLQMIDEYLDVTKIEFGEVVLNPEPVNLVALVHGYKNDFSYMASKKNITLKEKYAASALECVCDPDKIGEVVANLIDNAIKYSNPGTSVELHVKRENDSAWVGIKDEGAGIKPGELQYLFRGFGHKHISTQPTGGEVSTGLGLAICKRIVEVHQGEIGVESTPGQGSLFWFTLPITPP